VFHIVSNIFSLIFKEVLISLHSYLDSTHINCLTAMHRVFNKFCIWMCCGEISELVHCVLTTIISAQFIRFKCMTQLRPGTVAIGRKSLWPRAIDLSLLKHRYSDSSVATDRRRPLLLWLLVATGMLASFACCYSSPQ
jgi:hypothetical protein